MVNVRMLGWDPSLMFGASNSFHKDASCGAGDHSSDCCKHVLHLAGKLRVNVIVVRGLNENF